MYTIRRRVSRCSNKIIRRSVHRTRWCSLIRRAGRKISKIASGGQGKLLQSIGNDCLICIALKESRSSCKFLWWNCSIALLFGHWKPLLSRSTMPSITYPYLMKLETWKKKTNTFSQKLETINGESYNVIPSTHYVIPVSSRKCWLISIWPFLAIFCYQLLS